MFDFDSRSSRWIKVQALQKWKINVKHCLAITGIGLDDSQGY